MRSRRRGCSPQQEADPGDDEDQGDPRRPASAAGLDGPVPRMGRARLSVPETGALVIVLAALFIYFSIASPFFLNNENLINILQNVAVVGIIACPATLLLISGQFDLSVGSGVGFAGMLMAVAALAPGTGGVDLPLAMNMTVPSAFVIAVLGTMMIGINGFFVTVVGINALITTLGTLAVFRGLTKVLGDGQTIRIEGFGALGVERVFGIPLPVYIFAACVVVFWLVLRYTVYGRSLYAIGASPSAARLAGIRTKRVIFIAFLLSSAGRPRRPHPPLPGGGRLGQQRVGDRAVRDDGGRPRRREPVRRPWRSRRHGPGGAHRRGPGQRPHPAQRAVVLDRGGGAPAAGCRDRRSRARATDARRRLAGRADRPGRHGGTHLTVDRQRVDR